MIPAGSSCFVSYGPQPCLTPLKTEFLANDILALLLTPKFLLFLGLYLCGWPSGLETCEASSFQEGNCSSWVCSLPKLCCWELGRGGPQPQHTLGTDPRSFSLLCHTLLRGLLQALGPGHASVCVDAL